MMQQEFEKLAIRNGDHIGPELYAAIERFYMSENDYHAKHGGIYETKTEFIKRVFGGKVNTPKTICEKIARESIRENRFLLRHHNLSKARLDEMDAAILQHYRTLFKYGW